MPALTEPTDETKRTRAWIDSEHLPAINQLVLTIGKDTGGIIVPRDRVVNLLLKEALEARAKAAATPAKKESQRRGARATAAAAHV